MNSGACVEREEAVRNRQEETTRREERRNRYNNEAQRTRGLVNATRDYDTACLIRAYVAAIEKADNLDDDKRALVEWVKQKADWYDPTIV